MDQCERCKAALEELRAELAKAKARILELQAERYRLDDLLVKGYQ